MNDLIIGCFSNLKWDNIKYWTNSIGQCGFKGEKVMIVLNSDLETVDNLIKNNFKVIAFKKNDNGYFSDNTGIPVHVERFLHIWNYLNNLESKPRYVITTDIRDLVFQTNPSDWLENNLQDKKMIASSESIPYENEPWGNQNLLECFGSFFHNSFKKRIINNVGVLAGEFEYIKDLCLTILQMSLNRPIPIVDQAVYNMILWQKPWSDITKFCCSEDGWACQLGTTADPSKIEKFKPYLIEPSPVLTRNEVFTSDFSKKFCIVHQYDRIPSWRESIKEKYNV